MSLRKFVAPNLQPKTAPNYPAWYGDCNQRLYQITQHGIGLAIRGCTKLSRALQDLQLKTAPNYPAWYRACNQRLYQITPCGTAFDLETCSQSLY